MWAATCNVETCLASLLTYYKMRFAEAPFSLTCVVKYRFRYPVSNNRDHRVGRLTNNVEHFNQLVIHWSALLVIRSQIWIKISIHGVLVVEHWVNGPWAPPGLDVGQSSHLRMKMLMLAWQIANISGLRWLLARGGRHEFEETTTKDDKSYMFNFGRHLAYISILVDISMFENNGINDW